MPFIGSQNTANAKINKYTFTATSNQTVFNVVSGPGDELQVFLNGILLKLTDDYTYTTSAVTLGSGASASDILEVHVYVSFSVGDAVKASGDTMSGELEVPTVKLSSNIIKASSGGNSLTLDTSDNLTVAGNIKVGGNVIQASDGGNTITLDTSDNVAINGDLTVTGGDIKSSGGTTAISVSGANTTLAGTSNNVGTVTSGTLGSNVVFPHGTILQVKQIIKDNEFSTSSTSFVDLTGLSVGITPRFSSSKILVDVRLKITNSYFVAHGRLLRDSTEIGLASGTMADGTTSTNNRSRHLLDVTVENVNAEPNGVQGHPTALVLDSPTIPSTPIEIIYKVQVSARKDGAQSSITYVNRSPEDRDYATYDHRSISSITVYEIAQTT